jgi:integrase/recombinase XerD
MSYIKSSVSNAAMLFDHNGNRKYLTTSEWSDFVACAQSAPPEIETFCLTLAHTGARISEVLALTAARIDRTSLAIVIECLKKRTRGVYRAVPVAERLLLRLEVVHEISALQSDLKRRDSRLWPWCRTTAWQRVKEVMLQAGILDSWAMPKALRHAFGVHGTTEASVPLNMVQKWMGHARIETTAIYANAVGAEERALAERMWAHT